MTLRSGHGRGRGTPRVEVNVEHLADQLRADLEAVGLKNDRPELFVDNDVRRQMNAHDLRGTFVTIALAARKSEGWISRPTGHTTSAMIARYRRHADNLGEAQEVALRPLVEALPELHGPAPLVGGTGRFEVARVNPEVVAALGAEMEPEVLDLQQLREPKACEVTRESEEVPHCKGRHPDAMLH